MTVGTTLNAVVAGLRASLFASAAVAAWIYWNEGRAAWDLFVAILTRRKVLPSQMVSVASIGWLVVALSCVELGGYRFVEWFAWGRPVDGPALPHDQLWIGGGFVGLTTGFYLPIFAMFWYRGLLGRALAFALLVALVGLGTALASFAV